MHTAFNCPQCGAHYQTTNPSLAGKKIRCKSCGAGVRVPGEPVASTSQPAPAPARPAAAPPRTTVRPPQSAATTTKPPQSAKGAQPGGLDIYGLDEDAERDRKRARPTQDDGLVPDLPRVGKYEPPAPPEVKPKKGLWSSREKSRSSGGGGSWRETELFGGVSIGTVITIALITWRVYRVTRPFRAPAAPPAAVMAPVDTDDGDERVPPGGFQPPAGFAQQGPGQAPGFQPPGRGGEAGFGPQGAPAQGAFNPGAPPAQPPLGGNMPPNNGFPLPRQDIRNGDN